MKIRALTHRTWLAEEQFFLLLAIVIGVFSGLAVVCFRIGIEWMRLWLLGPSLVPPAHRALLAPTLVGLGIAILVIRLFPRARGSGVNQTKGALYISDGYIPFSTVIGKFITAGAAIGSGQSLGPEDPSLQIGAGLASLIGRKLHLSRERLRLVAPVGAAAGLAAAFNAPITAVLFVIEEVIGRWTAGILGSVVLAAVSSVVVERWFLGEAPLFHIPPISLNHPGELAAYAVLGVVGGVASVVFQKLIGFVRPRAKAFPRWSQYLQPAAAGFLIGLIGLHFPQVMGAGYEFIDQAMHDQFTWQWLGLLAGFKILATTLSFTSGTPGGLFAPALFIGAMLGGAVGSVERMFFPHLTVPVGAYALVGMGTLFAGFLRAPMTSVFMILEVSGNYGIIVPVIVSNTIAYLISRAFQRTPIFDLLSVQDGIHLPSMEEERETTILRVEDAMRMPKFPPLLTANSVSDAIAVAGGSGEEFLLIADLAGHWKGVSWARLLELRQSGAGDMPLRDAEPASVPALFPDHPLDVALRQIHAYPVLPVVHRANIHELIGVVSVQDIVAAYRKAGRADEDLSVPENLAAG